jgi:hypothetical protein
MVKYGDLPSMDADATDGLTNGDLLDNLKKKTKALDAEDDARKRKSRPSNNER